MTVSVIIATFNRAPFLAECLRNLALQTFEAGDEVVVVDNGSTDTTAQVITEARGLFQIPIRHLEEPTPGKSRALARALGVASGQVLAFTDDDVNVDRSWLQAIRAAMADGSIALVGGPVAPRWEAPPPAWAQLASDSYGRLAAPLALLNYGPDETDLGPRTLLGANLAVRREVLDQVGGFMPHLGKLRGTLLSGEDHDLCRRIQAAGFRTRYRPDVRVRHWVPTERVRVRYYLTWFFWSGITNAALDSSELTHRRSLAGVPLYLVKQGAAAVVGAFSAAIAGNRASVIERAVDVAFAAGYATRCWGLAGQVTRQGGQS